MTEAHIDGLIIMTGEDVDLGPCDRPGLLPRALLTYLEGCTSVARSARFQEYLGSLYACYEELVLATGRPMTAARLPAAAPRGRMGYCYSNTLALISAYPRLRYVEGYAMPWVGDRAGRPSLHAWAINSNGRVWDPTWPDPESSAYFGLEMSLADVARYVNLDDDTFGVLATEHLIGSPLLKTGRLFPADGRPRR